MEDIKIDCCGFTEKQKQEVVLELNRLGFITGHKSIDFYTFVYGCTGNTAYNNTIQFGNTAKTFAKNKGREVTLEELKQMPSECDERKEQDLISGADALQALADGKDVQVHESTYKKEIWFDLRKTKFTPSEILEGKVRDKPYKLTFRFKPLTIKLEIEIPAPFEPKLGEEYFYIQSCRNGYAKSRFNSEHCDQHLLAFGAWRTEEEIKQVVAALRGIKG